MRSLFLTTARSRFFVMDSSSGTEKPWNSGFACPNTNFFINIASRNKKLFPVRAVARKLNPVDTVTAGGLDARNHVAGRARLCGDITGRSPHHLRSTRAGDGRNVSADPRRPARIVTGIEWLEFQSLDDTVLL